MDCELAKQLKEAGFPQNIACNHHAAERCTCFEKPYIPTLDDLIEACGERFECVVQRDDGIVSDYMNIAKWVAGSRGYIGDENVPTGEGKDPKEAVARLWLHLHGKS